MKFNNNLTSIKCVLFLFFGGLGCLYPFLPLHMLSSRLTLEEAKIVSIVAPCIAILGPIAVGPLADYLAGGFGGKARSKTGNYLRFMTAATLLLAVLFYLLLLSVPTVFRFKARSPSVSFTCSPHGGVVLQERCTEEKTCRNNEKAGSLLLSNCKYVCHEPLRTRLENNTDLYVDSTPLYEDTENSTDYEFEDSGNGPLESDAGSESNERTKRQNPQTEEILEPPHICQRTRGETLCQVYTEDTKRLFFNVRLRESINSDNNEEEWCQYPVRGSFSCRISSGIENWLIRQHANVSNSTCHPVVLCDVDDPYTTPGSAMAESQCVQIVGDPNYTFWTYLFLRSVADIFSTASIALLDGILVIATRETSSGRGDIGRQLVFGCLGLIVFAPIAGALIQDVMVATSPSYYNVAFIMFAVLLVLAALILLFDSRMPLSPPEWWWHTKCGMLALPMSSVRKYSLEVGALMLVTFLLGTLWSALDSYFPYHLFELKGTPLLIGLTVTVGTIPALPFLWFAEIIVDYCGHANLLITAFTIYLVRFTGLSFIDNSNWTLICDALEVFTLTLMWVTIILYMRHLMPRRFTVTGQALPVFVHFCIGRCIGAIIGGLVKEEDSDRLLDSLRLVYRALAVTSAIIAALYFIIYHLWLKRYVAPIAAPPATEPPTVMQGINGNGSYTPLRVYHNGRARKGQFRY